ncbi:MAG TPA: RelA/SpoT family protein [Saprospiraceae bacterium]|nr:RelA/SpoT family protein [Saprospiraceae bacterium]
MNERKLHVAQDDKLIDDAYQNLLSALPPSIEAEDRRNIAKAFQMAREAHHTQRRKSGEPYILHPIEVARICAEEIGLGPTAIVAALLHDVVEDTAISKDDIEHHFNKKIALIVEGLTKLEANFDEDQDFTHSIQAENFKKVLRAMLIDVRVVLVKMADRLHNMRTLGAMPKHKQLRIAAETSFIYSPLAHRLGLYNIKTEFEDMSMKITDADNYFAIAQKLKDTKRNRQVYIKSFIDPLKEVLDAELDFGFEIYGRPKSIHSINNKIQNKNVEFEEIYDLFAIRIIVDAPLKLEKAVCWQIYSIVTDVHEPIPERLKDWITTPKSNGYESLHTTVIGPGGRYVEVQIRSKRMDEIAERGFAAHWKYKGELRSDDVYDKWLVSIRETLESPESDTIDFLGDLKSNLFNEEVFVYTPNGDLKVLPKGATALDFAYSIHSEVGNQCAGVKLENKMVPLNYILSNGDQLEVITNKSQKPTEDWLKFVKTARAKSKIRGSLKEREKEMAGMGKEKLLRKLDQMKVDYDSNIEFLIDHYAFDNAMELFLAIYEEKFNLNQLKTLEIQGKKLLPRKKGIIEKIVGFRRSDGEEQPIRKKKKKTDSQAKVTFPDNADFQYQLAPCCNPVLGDNIFGFINISGGIKIHRSNCPNAEHLMANYGYRVIKADWVDEENTPFTVELLIEGLDKGPGVIESVSSSLSSQLGLNIKSFYIDGHEGYFKGKVSIIVKNKEQLNQAIDLLKKMDEIHSVSRSN